MEDENGQITQATSGALTRARIATGAAIAFERFWPKLLPLLVLALVFAAISWAGLFRLLPEPSRYAVGAIFALLALAAFAPFVRLRLPGSDEITTRIESANALQHQPISVQSDKPAGDNDAFSQALWAEHQRRMAEKLGAVSPDKPRPAIPRLDPYALRSIPVLFAAVALAFSFSGSGGRLTDIFHGAPAAEKIPPRIDAWVTPPGYTGRAPIFLTSAANADTKAFSIPVNSDITLRVIGGSGTEIAALGTSVLKPAEVPKDDAPAQPIVFKAKLTADGELTLKDGETSIRDWQFKIIPDVPPKIDFVIDPERALNGTLTLTYKGTDDYGIASAKALIVPEIIDPKTHPLFEAPEVKLSTPGRKSKDGIAKTSKDLAEHPWAGASVRLSLSATDDAKQEGRSPSKTILLPEKIFSNMLAAALIEQRRMLAMDANTKPRVLDLLDALTMRPEDTIKNPSHFLGLHTARVRLAAASNDEALRDVVAYLWQIANGIEDSGLSDAQKRMKQAQENLAQALENGASDAEIEKLMKELRDAMNGVMKELAEQAKKNPNLAQSPPNARELSQSDIDKMMEKIEELSKQGAKDQAKELLSQLNEMMNNLQMGQGQQQAGENGEAMSEQLNKLGDMMRRQQELMDQTQRLDQQGEGQSGENGDPSDGQGQEGQNGQGQQPGENGQGQGPNGQGQSFGGLQDRQGQLRRDLEGMMGDLRGLGLDPGKAFGDAGKSMGQAEGNLGEGEGGEALADQSDALDALRKGGESLMNQMQEAMGKDGGGMQPGQRRGGNAQNDPLGRPRSTTGPDFGQTTKIPDDIDVQRAREILDAIRKRLGDAISPQIEKNYLERLLKFD